jgi:hypothetical protein
VNTRELIRNIEKKKDRYYSYDTPIDCQIRLIRLLENHFDGVHVIERPDQLPPYSKSDTFNILVIQNAGKIFENLPDLKDLEVLIKSEKRFLIFFNGKPGNEIDHEKLGDWLRIVEDTIHLYPETFEFIEEPKIPGENENSERNKWWVAFFENLMIRKLSAKVIIVVLIVAAVVFTFVMLISNSIILSAVFMTLSGTLFSVIGNAISDYFKHRKKFRGSNTNMKWENK